MLDRTPETVKPDISRTTSIRDSGDTIFITSSPSFQCGKNTSKQLLAFYHNTRLTLSGGSERFEDTNMVFPEICNGRETNSVWSEGQSQ